MRERLIRIFETGAALALLTLVVFLTALAVRVPPVEAQATRPGSIELVGSAARTATFNGDARQNPTGARGAIFLLNVTAASGTTPTLDVKLQWQDATTSTWSDISGASFQRITTTGTRTLTIYPTPEGDGLQRVYVGTDPAAGAEFSETVPVNTRWKVHSFWVGFVTSATVATRVPSLVVDDGTATGVAMRVGVGGSMTATTGPIIGWIAGSGIAGSNTSTFQGSLSPGGQLMQGGWRLRSSTSSLQAGDDYAAPSYMVEEFVGNYATTSLPRTFRAVATIAGTTPSFTFSVSGTTLP